MGLLHPGRQEAAGLTESETNYGGLWLVAGRPDR
jgi:hypothetical protein